MYHITWYIWLLDWDAFGDTATAVFNEFVNIRFTEPDGAAQFDVRQNRMIATAGVCVHPGDAHIQSCGHLPSFQ
jgi:hypothetical protein